MVKTMRKMMECFTLALRNYKVKNTLPLPNKWMKILTLAFK
jgi:hypothetical protein